jgi:hypothetical protein
MRKSGCECDMVQPHSVMNKILRDTESVARRVKGQVDRVRLTVSTADPLAPK